MNLTHFISQFVNCIKNYLLYIYKILKGTLPLEIILLNLDV